MNPDWIKPEWPAPANVHAVVTTRQGGFSQAPYDSLNVGDHVGDDPYAVAKNRHLVGDLLHLPTEPLWLQQVHGVVVSGMNTSSCTPQADAAVAFKAKQVCVVMTADCLPVLFCDKAGTRVAAAHAGWRGLCDGVLEETVKALDCQPHELLAWMGPAIGPSAFEVGSEVRAEFIQYDAQAEQAFVKSQSDGKWLGDLYQLARQRLNNVGLSAICGGGFCTYTDKARFFSYRRDNVTGRMASLIWLSTIP